MLYGLVKVINLLRFTFAAALQRNFQEDFHQQALQTGGRVRWSEPKQRQLHWRRMGDDAADTAGGHLEFVAGLLGPGQTILPTQANLSQVSHNVGGIGYRLSTHLPRGGSSWLAFDQAQIFAQLESSFHRLANSSQLSLSCFVIVMWLRGRIQTIEWFLVSWLDLAVPFGHPPMQVLIF